MLETRTFTSVATAKLERIEKIQKQQQKPTVAAKPQKLKHKKPLVVANVDLGKGKSDQLVLMEGMLVDEQIQAFATKNSCILFSQLIILHNSKCKILFVGDNF